METTSTVDAPLRLQNVIFEVTQVCNHHCLYCYNVWKGQKPYPLGELDTAGTLRLLHRIVDETHCDNLTISGGEPLLRKDLTTLIEGIRPRLKTLTLISNGSLMTSERGRQLMNAGVDLFEISLVTLQPNLMNRIARANTHSQVVDHILGLKELGARVVTVFVAMRENLHDLENVLKFNIAAGVDGMMFNRVNPGGEGRRYAARLLPSSEALKKALALLQDYASRYPIGISCGIPMMPCLFDMKLYPNLGYGFCLGADGERSYYTLDPMGNVRICNHSDTILGNILEKPFAEILEQDYVRTFKSKLPSFCGDCAEKAKCQGGCRAASEVCSGDLCAEEPFLASIPTSCRRKPG